MTESASPVQVVEELRATRTGRALSIRLLVTIGALVIWFWTQSLIGSRGFRSGGIGDQLHAVTSVLNLYLHTHPAVANVLLIVSSGIIDLLGIFLLSKWIFGGCVRPFLGPGDRAWPATNHAGTGFASGAAECDLALPWISVSAGDLWRRQ